MTLSKSIVYPIIKTVRDIWSTAETPAGLLVRLTHDGSGLVAAVLRASGYTVTEIDDQTVLVGGVDRLALLEGQIAALTAERDALLQERRSTVGAL
ncbi:hypothetical protein ABZ635_07195 [Nocardiopsis sp. NPDC007018]|uniref:hypothetical protein n=1 Tax=Nocardiopsis sp. NPDC007018 TaxID=3155721 RepID=UPI0033E77E04